VDKLAEKDPRQVCHGPTEVPRKNDGQSTIKNGPRGRLPQGIASVIKLPARWKACYDT